MRLEINAERAIYFGPTTPSLMAVLGQFEGRRQWLKTGGLRVDPTQHNVDVFTNVFPEIEIDDGREIAGFGFYGEEFQPADVDVPFKSDPWPHQIAALDKFDRKTNVFALFMEQGTGKSKVIIDWVARLWARGEITGCLVFSRKGAHEQWIAQQFPEHCPIPWIGAAFPFWWEGFEGLNVDGKLQVASFNWDSFKGTGKGNIMAREFCKRHSGKLVIIGDESQDAKNHTSARHKALCSDEIKGQSTYRAIATGTPIAKDLSDEWAQFQFLDPAIIGMEYITTFKRVYCEMGGFNNKAVIGHRNLKDFKAKTDPYTFRVEKTDIGLPPKQYAQWAFSLTPAQRDLINEVKEELTASLPDLDVPCEIPSAVSAMTKIQQISNGFYIENIRDDKGRAIRSEVHRIMPVGSNPRAHAAISWLQSFDEKAILWYRFSEDREIIKEALTEAGIVWASYEGSDLDRRLAKDSWLATGGPRVFIANPQSAGTGLNLQGQCRKALYYSNSFNAIDRWQSEDRIDRIGMGTGSSEYTDLIARNSIDRKILQNLKAKKGLSDLVLGDVLKSIEED